MRWIGAKAVTVLWTVVPLLAIAGGCHAVPHHDHEHFVPPVGGDMPRELSKVTLPTYTIEPPDILVIEALHVIPKPPYKLRAADQVSLQVEGTLPDNPIAGIYPVQPGGLLNLGLPYGSVKVTGLTVEEAQVAIETHLKEYLREPRVVVALADMAGRQQIAGSHLVGPDGVVTLGSYGGVNVVGMTVAEAKAAVEQHLSQFLDEPEIAIDVFAYNSKVYYVITEGAGLGDTVTRFPVTGNETVLDAISNINGLTEVSSTKIWVARPTPNTSDVQIMPVDWKGISGLAATGTNYQLMPGDRVFIADNKWVAFDNSLAKLLAPVERVMGFSLLGVGTLSRFSGKVLQNQGGGGFGGGAVIP